MIDAIFGVSSDIGQRAVATALLSKKHPRI